MATIGLRRLAQLCRRVGLQLQAGVDTRTIWSKEADRAPPGHRIPLEKLSMALSQGHSMAEAVDQHGYFPRLTRDMIEVGERTGRLDFVMLNLAEHYEHLLSLRRNFIGGITFVAIELALAIGIIGLLILVLGMLTSNEMGVFGLSGVTGFITYGLIVVLVVGSVAAAIYGFLKDWYGPLPMIILIRIPGLGGCIRSMAMARMAWSLSMALDAGIDARRSIRMAIRSTQNSFYTAHTETVDQVILQGGEFHEALRKTKAFPDEFVDSVETAELSGTHSESMARLAEEYRARAEVASKVLTTIASVGVWMLVAGMMIAAIIYLYWTLYLKNIYDLLP